MLDASMVARMRASAEASIDSMLTPRIAASRRMSGLSGSRNEPPL